MRQRKVVVHTFSGVVAAQAVQTAFVPELSIAVTFFCLASYPGEISQSYAANRELSNDVWVVEVHLRKVALPTCSQLTPTEV